MRRLLGRDTAEQKSSGPESAAAGSAGRGRMDDAWWGENEARWARLSAPGPGIWLREREHRRAPRDAISEYIGSDEHQQTGILQERFNTAPMNGDTRGWGYWTPPTVNYTHGGHPREAYKTRHGFGHGGGRREEVPGADIPGLWWMQPGPPAPPLGIDGGATIKDLAPFLDAAAEGQSIFDHKPWLADLQVWEQTVKPSAIAEHQRLQQVDPSQLQPQNLLVHLEECYANSHMAGALHGHFGSAFGTPLNHFLASCMEWTDCTPRELVDCVAGHSVPTVIATNPPSVAMARAIRGSPNAQAILDGCPSSDNAQAKQAIAMLEADMFAGRAVVDFKNWVGNRLVDGHTGIATPPILIETPATFVRLIKSAVQHFVETQAQGLAPDSSLQARVSAEAEARVRARIPAAHMAEFDEMLSEARQCYKLRDERVNYADSWADGLTRRAVLEVGRRLVEQGACTDQAIVMEATVHELPGLISGTPSSSLIRSLEEQRAERKKCHIHLLPPAVDGEPLPPHPEPDASGLAALKRWVSPQTALNLDRMDRLNAMRGVLEKEEKLDNVPGARRHHGVGVSGGVYEGEAIVGVMGVDVEVHDLCDGKIFVTAATSSPFNLIIPSLGGLVCDGGSLLAHPAITAREHGVPCIVGAGGICSFVQTGDRLRIDPNTGTIDINVTPNGPTSMPYAGSAPSSMPYAIGNGAPSTVSEQGSVAPSMPLSAWLAANNLQACAPVLARLGYDQGVDMLVESDNEESRDMIRAVAASPEIKKPVAKKFERELAKLRTGAA